MNRIFALRTLFATTLLAATAAASAAGFPAATGEFSPVDLPQAQAQPAAPGRTAPADKAKGRTRAEVLAEFEAARCRGELPYDGETGRTYRDVFPGQYPMAACR